MAEGESRLQQLHEGVEEIQDIMLKNINRVEEREAKLEELDERAEELLKRGKQFQRSTRKVKEKVDSKNSCMRGKNKKVIAVIAGAVALAIIITITIIIIATQNQNQNGENENSD